MLLQALSDTTVVRASVFLLGRGVLLSLADIPPGGATVSLLGRQHGKSVYRLSIRTRSREIFDMAINVAEELTFAQLRDEVNWLLAAGAPPPLVEPFGGYFPEWGIFTEEFIPGDDVERQVARLLRQSRGRSGSSCSGPSWPGPRWSCTSRFWDRTGRRLALRLPSPAAFIVPSHDYQTGARLVSIADRSPCSSLDDAARPLPGQLPRPGGGFAPRAARRGDRADAAGGRGGGARRGAGHPGAGGGRQRQAGHRRLLLPRPPADRGATPLRLFFAVRRFKRWLEVNPQATPEAQSKHLGELWGTYRLGELEAQWPDTRIRFFRQTVFADARPELGAALDRLMHRARSLPAGALDLAEQVAALRAAVKPTEAEDYVLARMTYRHLGPAEQVALISMPHGDHFTAEVVVAPGRQRRQPLHAARAGLAARGGAPAPALPRVQPGGGLRHRARVPAGARRQGVGHRRHLLPAGGRRAHPHGEDGGGPQAPRQGDRRRADARVLPAAARPRRLAVETGYFQPEYLKRFGFRTDPSSGGLVRDLDADESFEW